MANMLSSDSEKTYPKPFSDKVEFKDGNLLGQGNNRPTIIMYIGMANVAIWMAANRIPSSFYLYSSVREFTHLPFIYVAYHNCFFVSELQKKHFIHQSLNETMLANMKVDERIDLAKVMETLNPLARTIDYYEMWWELLSINILNL